MAIPLRHFLVATALFVLAAGLGVLAAVRPGWGVTIAHVHVFLAGGVCVTILGAMTQFVPVWSSTALYSRRLAVLQLPLVTVGVLGFAASLIAGNAVGRVAFATVLLAGFWCFAYNLGRTLLSVRPLDVTERHFALGVAFLVVVTTFGYLLAVDLTWPVLGPLGLSHAAVLSAHATLAVFGAVLATVLGALYQLATMFTGTALHGVDHSLRRVEEGAFGPGVVLLAVGRLLAWAPLARLGGGLVVVGLLAFSAVLARRLVESRVGTTPMLARYAVVAASMALWAGLAGLAWSRAPLAWDGLFGAPGSAHLLFLGVILFVVVGTLYHVVPFVVWVHRYSDRVGYERVPMVDDLYSHRVATVDFVAMLGGGLLLVASPALGVGRAGVAVGGALVTVGLLLFAGNLLLVVVRHSPTPLRVVLFGGVVGRRTDRGPAARTDRRESGPETEATTVGSDARAE